jgi:hypothetical protein
MRLRLGLLAIAAASMLLAQNPAPAPSTDVYLYRLDQPSAGVVNITKRAGYDNQPGWVGGSLYWTSQLNGQTDIYTVDLKTNLSSAVTQTPESEYSAAPTPDERGFAVIRVEMDSTQRLWRFPLRTKEAPRALLPDIKPVGYFAYLDANTLALFVLGSQGRPATLQIADERTGKGTVVTTSPGRSIQHVPGGRRASFTQRVAGGTVLQTVDPTPRADSSFAVTAVALLPDSADYVVWKSATHAITGAGSRLMQLQLPSKEWTVLADLSAHGIRRISRLALSPDGIHIAFVADEPRAP